MDRLGVRRLLLKHKYRKTTSLLLILVGCAGCAPSFAVEGLNALARVIVNKAEAQTASITLNAATAPFAQTMYTRGQTVQIKGTIKSSVAKTYHVELRIKDRSGAMAGQLYLYNQSLSSTAKSYSFNYTIPSTLKMGAYSTTVLAWSTDWSTSYPVSQNKIEFNLNTYQPAIASLSLPSSVIRLKTKAGNPFTGGGFIPNTSTPYVMVFNDEFSGTNLDTSKWWTRYIYADGYLDRLNDECQAYQEKNNHVVSGGTLKLVARPLPGTQCWGTGTPGYTKWESGMIRSKAIIKHGYIEARVKMPSGTGVWPAFWMTAENMTWPPEIDIFEYVINTQTELPNMLHSGVIEKYTHTGKGYNYSDPYFDRNWSFWRAPSPLLPSVFSDDYHIISSLWNSDDTVTTYLDGIPLVQYRYNWVDSDGHDAGLAHIMLNLAMGGSWPTYNWTVPMTTSEQKLEIDYVRVYQRSDRVNKATSTSGKDLCPATGC